MEKITAFEGSRDATFYREFIAEQARELEGRYFRFLIHNGIMYTEKDNIYVQCCSEAKEIAESALYCGGTVEEFNALIDRLEVCKQPLVAWIHKRLQEEGFFQPKDAPESDAEGDSNDAE